MSIIKRGLVTAAIVGTLMGGVVAMPAAVAARAHPNQNGANCHGVLVSQAVEFEGTGMGHVNGGQAVQQEQQDIRETCSLIG